MNVAAELEFNPVEWRRLGPSERVRRCEQFAEHARQLSVDAAPELKKSYLELSQNWLALATEIERYSNGSGPSSVGLQPGASEHRNR